MVECTGLENRKIRKGFQGSNPCLSASFEFDKIAEAILGVAAKRRRSGAKRRTSGAAASNLAASANREGQEGR